MQPHQNLLFSGLYCTAMPKIKYVKNEHETSEIKNIRERPLWRGHLYIEIYRYIYIYSYKLKNIWLQYIKEIQAP